MEWSKETILHFISLIRERPAIWDSKSPEYKIRQNRHDAVDEVALLMGVSTKDVNTKWTVLRNQYSREKRKMTGMRGTDSIYTTKWFAYKEMKTLMSCNTPQESLNNFQRDDSSLEPPPRSPPSPPPPSTPTPPPYCPSICGVRRGKKRESDAKTSVYREAVQTYKVMRENKNESSPNTDDDLTSYGLYIAAHLRKFSPRLQSKAKYQINNILYALDMESLGEYSASVASMDDS